MSRISVNPGLIYGKKDQETTKVLKPQDKVIQKTKKSVTPKNEELVSLSEKSKELKEKLSSAQKSLKLHEKKFGNIEKPGVYFVSGFDWFGAGSIKGNYDGIKDMADAVEGAKHFSWNKQDEIIEDIKKRKANQPIILVGHSFGGDGVIEVAERLNTIENGFRKIDLLVTLDSVGFDNDLIPQNAKKNINFLAQGPYSFLNDGPNIARNYERTKVFNFLRSEEHAELDDVIDIQVKILEEIEKAIV